MLVLDHENGTTNLQFLMDTYAGMKRKRKVQWPVVHCETRIAHIVVH